MYPELWLKVYVSGPPGDQQGFPEMFCRARCYKADTPEEADLVVFTGGTDVDPSLYAPAETKVHPSVYLSEYRDKSDLELYAKCYELGIPMFGVCRGAQFGAVMNGCELYQDVDGHNGGHHTMFLKEGGSINVSSVHHQMVVRSDNMELIGWSKESDKRFVNATLVEHGSQEDVEAFFFEDSCFFGVQGHPEYKGYSTFTNWCFKQIEDLIVNNPNVVATNGKQRDAEMEKAA
jgi:gamma-glutamyl-gamma-aminobutyrate hydrolase PuuD